MKIYLTSFNGFDEHRNSSVIKWELVGAEILNL